MFIIKGTINTTHDIEKAKQLSLYDANKVIALVDGNDSSLSALPNISIGSILLPPFIAMENFLNGNYFLWRFVLYSIQFIGFSWFLYKAKLNTYPIFLKQKDVTVRIHLSFINLSVNV